MSARNPRGEMPFLDHLEELRWRILWSLLAVTVGTLIGLALCYRFNVLGLLVAPVRSASSDPNLRLVFLSPTDPFFVTLKLALVVGILLASPVVVYEAWSFLAPALEPHEKKAIVPALYFGLFLFMCGVVMAYYALPVTLKFFDSFQQQSLEANLEVSNTLAFITKMLLAFGFLFELPILIMVLTAIGLVTPRFLREKRRHAIVVITAAAAWVTPGDAVTLTLALMLPLVLLYELSILLSTRIYRRRQRRLGEELRPSGEPPEGAVPSEDPVGAGNDA